MPFLLPALRPLFSDADVSLLVELRRDLHQHPELSWQEQRTSSRLADVLASLGAEDVARVAGTGVVARFAGKDRSAPVVAVRGDIDALPIEEATGLPFASTAPGVMHACGHDIHGTWAVGAALLLARSPAAGDVLVVLQPAEEVGEGARAILETGALDDVKAIFGGHVDRRFSVGQVVADAGPLAASADMFEIELVGKGAHGARPHESADPIVGAAALVTALQTIVARNVEPGEEAVITVGNFEAGTAATIIPEAARLKVGIRSCSDQARDLLERRVVEVAQSQAASLGCTVDVVYERSYPCLINSAQEYDLARSVALTMRSEEGVRDLARPFMLSEDFAYMLRELPGCYFFMGNGPTASLHDCRYDFNDDAILPGVRYWAALAEHYLAA